MDEVVFVAVVEGDANDLAGLLAEKIGPQGSHRHPLITQPFQPGHLPRKRLGRHI